MHVTLRNPNCQKTVLDNGATLDGSPTAILYCRYSMPYRRNDSKILVVLLRRIWGVLITRNKQQNQDAVSVG